MRKNRISIYLCVAIFMLAMLFATFATADVKLPALISDNMVIQRHVSVPIWGNADPGEKVTVNFNGKNFKAVADKDGKWIVKFKALKAGGPYEMTVSGKNKIIVKDVMVGEVWICSGQSNMQWDVRNSANVEKETADANFPMIRMFTVKRTVSDKPLSDTSGNWAICSPQTVAGFSAVGYFFARDLYNSLKVPIGMIHTSWGSTPAESWTPMEILMSDPDFKPILDRWEKAVASYPEAQKKYQEQLAQWETDSKKTKDEGKQEPKKPNPPQPPETSPFMPSSLYNAMINPLIPYAIKGAIWYQGESNAGRAYQYRKLFPEMIKSWRKAWGKVNFPFLFVQLANFMPEKPEPSDSAWAELREAQTMTLSLPNTGMAVIIDIGDAKDIHPKNKQDVGHRLALNALATAYGRSMVFSGPLYQSMESVGDKIRIKFRYSQDGLMAKNDEQLKGFAIAGEDKKFVWANAQTEGDSVIVWSDKVTKPMAVRYAWADNPVCNLYNKSELPASPFRTDDWKGITADNK